MRRFILLSLLVVLFISGCDGYDDGGSSILPVIDSFYASPAYISPGGESTLSWSVSGASMVTLDQGIGVVYETGVRSVRPDATTIYTLTASNSVGSVTQSTQVTVEPKGLVKISIYRKCETSDPEDPAGATLGELWLGGFHCYTLELPNRENRSGDYTTAGRIPAGIYKAKVVDGTEGHECSCDGKKCPRIELIGTEPKTHVQIHNGNYPKDSESCILVGKERKPDTFEKPDPDAYECAQPMEAIYYDSRNGQEWHGAVGVSSVDTLAALMKEVQRDNRYPQIEVTIYDFFEKLEIRSFSASPWDINLGETSTLSWEVAGAQEVTLQSDDNLINKKVELKDSLIVSPAYTTHYMLRASNKCCQICQELKVRLPLPPNPNPTPPTPTPRPPTPPIEGCMMIQKIGFSDPPPLTAGNPVKFGVVLVNSCNDVTTSPVQCYVDGMLWDSGVFSLSAGESITLWTDSYWMATTGSHTLRVTTADDSMSRDFTVNP